VGDVGGAVVGHDRSDVDSVLVKPGDCAAKEGDRAGGGQTVEQRLGTESSMNGSIPTAHWSSCKFSRRRKPRFAPLLQSPLTDSNRRPPPYHGTSQATGGSRWQRIWPVFAVCGPERFAADCRRLQPRGSIKAPSAARRMSHQITAMNLCAYIVRCVRRGASRGATIEQLATPPPRRRGRVCEPYADAPAIQSRRSTRRRA
jgi:hypothetical protein